MHRLSWIVDWQTCAACPCYEACWPILSRANDGARAGETWLAERCARAQLRGLLPRCAYRDRRSEDPHTS